MLEKYMSKPDIEKEKIQKNCEKEPFNFRTDLATERRDKRKYNSRTCKNNKGRRTKSNRKANRKLYNNRYKKTKNSTR